MHSDVLQTNFHGPKRVSEAFVGMIAPGGRIANVSSGSASMWLREQSDATKAHFSNAGDSTTWAALDAAVQAAAGASSGMGGYGLSKAGLTAYTMIQAREHPNLLCTSLSPGEPA